MHCFGKDNLAEVLVVFSRVHKCPEFGITKKRAAVPKSVNDDSAAGRNIQTRGYSSQKTEFMD
jgi:hypothetical protein